MYRILVIGDVVGRTGRKVLFSHLAELQKEFDIHFTVVNGENAVTRNGITEKYAYQMLEAGTDVITLGNHAFDKSDIFPMLEKGERIIRPLNYPPERPGDGVYLTEKNGVRIAVINLIGRVYLDEKNSCPFVTGKKAAENLKDRADVILVDFHAEATSEKQALGYYLDGEITALYGTHTHVQTNDERILPGGTAYLTDVGMTGPVESVIGLKKEIAIPRFLGERTKTFEWAEGEGMINGIVYEIDGSTFRVQSMIQINRKYRD